MALVEEEQAHSGAISMEIDAISDHLDHLWARYLNLLDEYTSAQAAIKKAMASGFLDLAQANFKSPGKRYGRDYYDQRTIAISRAAIHEDNHLQIVNSQGDALDRGPGGSDVEDSADTKSMKVRTTSGLVEDTQQLPSPSPSPEPEALKHKDSKNSSTLSENDTTQETSTASSDEKSSSEAKVKLTDPLRWFGILVPPALRSAQQNFRSAIQDDDCVAKAVNAARNMREMEADIRRTRKSLRKAEKLATAER